MVAPVFPATWETEAGELLQTEKQRLQWAEIMLLHSSLGNKSKTSSQKIMVTESKSEMVVARGQGKAEVELLINWHKISVKQDE